MRIGNPSLRRWVSKSQRGELETIEPATYKGVYGKSAIFGLLTLIAAVATEFIVLQMFQSDIVSALVGVSIGTAVCAIVALVISIVIVFAPSTVKVLGMIYSVLQGGLLGCLALLVDIFAVPGISLAALLGTSIVFLISLAVNKLFKVKISSKFMRGAMVVFFSLIVVELIMWLLTSTSVISYASSTLFWIQLAISAVCVIWATIMLMWDLQSIDYLVQSGADKKYEWNVAFSLVTTLIYLYVEILELLLRLVALFGNKKK